ARWSASTRSSNGARGRRFLWRRERSGVEHRALTRGIRRAPSPRTAFDHGPRRPNCERRQRRSSGHAVRTRAVVVWLFRVGIFWLLRRLDDMGGHHMSSYDDEQPDPNDSLLEKIRRGEQIATPGGARESGDRDLYDEE